MIYDIYQSRLAAVHDTSSQYQCSLSFADGREDDPSSSTMGEKKRVSDEASKRKITNPSLSPDLPSKSKRENKTTFFLVVLINSPIFATD